MQSVMKLIVGAAAMDAIDRGRSRLDEPVVIRHEDLSLHVQPLARIVRERGELRTTIDDLIARAVTAHLLDVMSRTRTFPTRLRASAPAGWRVAHKTGTSADWKGQNGVTNDVGLLFAPDGGVVAVAAFLAEPRQDEDARDAVLARAARGSPQATGRSSRSP